MAALASSSVAVMMSCKLAASAVSSAVSYPGGVWNASATTVNSPRKSPCLTASKTALTPAK